MLFFYVASRTHQIRVHLQHRRTPILGDDAYGSEDWNRRYLRSHGIRRPLLHAYQVKTALLLNED